MWIVIIGIGVCYSAYNIKLCAIRYYSYPSAVKPYGFTFLCPDVPNHRAYRNGPCLWTHQSHQRLPMVLFDFQKWWHVWTVCILDQKFNENTPGYYLIYHYYMVNQNTLPSVQIMEQFWTVKLSCNRIPGKAPRIINIDRLFDRPWVHNKGSKILIWLNSTWTRSLIFICHFANTTGL